MNKNVKSLYMLCLLAGIASGCSSSNDNDNDQTGVDNGGDMSVGGTNGSSASALAMADRNSQPTVFDASVLQASFDSFQSVEPVLVNQGDTVLDLIEKAKR